MTMTFEIPNHQTTLAAPSGYRPRRDMCDRVDVTTSCSTTSRSIAGPAQQSRKIRPIAFVVTAVIVLVAVLGFGSDAAATNDQLSNAGSDAIEVYVVQPGDTLWEIANQIAEPGEDVRPLVDELEQLAGGVNLEVGQRLVIDHMTIRD